ncbi:NUDIX domain-containing protein [Candidatus Woesebacteria bacterium]|nr:MAG: NUDIX domain-containing protein [Candidatus Woesebacteria bacterium]
MIKEIKVKAMCIIKHNDKLLLNKGFDSIKNETFYRLIGGHVEFGEKAIDTLKREIFEELGVEIFNLEFVTPIEEIFIYQGERGHEVIFVFEGELRDEKVLGSETIPNPDSPNFPAVWIPVSLVKDKSIICYPTFEIEKYI